MSTNGHPAATAADALRWPGRVVSALELGRRLNGHRRLLLPANAVVTPAALDELRSRGVSVERDAAPATATATATAAGCWGCGQDRAYAAVQSALQALQRDGFAFTVLPANEAVPAAWARRIAACVADGTCAGGVVFCEDPGTVCCVANKVAGLRAVAVATTGQLGRALLALAPNLVAVEMPGRTFFEVRQILRTVGGAHHCPDGVACTLRELDGHAHR
jgi:hypothetical protein